MNSYFTAFMDSSLNGTVESCTTAERLKTELWMKDEPNNSNDMELCTALDFNYNSPGGMWDVACKSTVSRRFICHVNSILI
jgi:hypothetical protein